MSLFECHATCYFRPWVNSITLYLNRISQNLKKGQLTLVRTTNKKVSFCSLLSVYRTMWYFRTYVYWYLVNAIFRLSTCACWSGLPGLLGHGIGILFCLVKFNPYVFALISIYCKCKSRRLVIVVIMALFFDFLFSVFEMNKSVISNRNCIYSDCKFCFNVFLIITSDI